MVSLGGGQMKALFSIKWLVSIYQCWNYSMNKNCFACMTPSNPNFDKCLWIKSFSQRRIEKLDSIVLVPGKSVAMTPQYSIRFENWAPSKDQPSLKLELLESESMSSFNTGSGLCAHRQWDRSELMSNNDPIGKHVAEYFEWSRLQIARWVHAVALGE